MPLVPREGITFVTHFLLFCNGGDCVSMATTFSKPRLPKFVSQQGFLCVL